MTSVTALTINGQKVLVIRDSWRERTIVPRDVARAVDGTLRSSQMGSPKTEYTGQATALTSADADAMRALFLVHADVTVTGPLVRGATVLCEPEVGEIRPSEHWPNGTPAYRWVFDFTLRQS